MHFEYLLFNLLVICGPLFFSFDRKVAFYRLWPRTMAAVLLSIVPYVTWDILVSGRHWYFNPNYTLNTRWLGLPPGEWLFFITVPFACVFVWQVLDFYLKDRHFSLKLLYFSIPFLLISGIVLLFYHLEYTALAALSLALVLIADILFKTRILDMKQSGPFFLLLLLLILVFNGYLTGRPLVLYYDQYNLGLRIFTIPVEDFLFGISHIVLTLFFFELIGRRRVE